MSDWGRLGTYVVARRVELGFKQRTAFADALQISVRVLSDIENGRRSNFDAVTIASLERVLGWETGSVKRIAAGGEPEARRGGAASLAIEASLSGAGSPGGDGPISSPTDEIEMIYNSRSMTAEEKLEAIRRVLHLRAQVDAQAEAASAHGEAFDATVETRPPVKNGN